MVSRSTAVPVLGVIFGLSLSPPAGIAAPEVRTFEFTYAAKVAGIPDGTGKVSIWIPYPVSDENQEISAVRVSAPVPTFVRRDPEYGNSILYLSVEDPGVSTIEVEMAFRVKRREVIRKEFRKARSGTGGKSDPDVARWLEPDRLVPLDAFVRGLAKKVTRGKDTDLEKARAIYDYAVSTVSYDKSGTGWGRGDLYYACNFRKGNCTDFHALFIGLTRAAGIPAKFAIGFPLPEERGRGKIGGYHCWAEFYLEGYGWVPVDVSEGNRHPEKREYFFGAHDENRVQFTVGRDLVLAPPQSGGEINYFIYPHVEVDGKVFSGVENKFSFRDLAAPRSEPRSFPSSEGRVPRTPPPA